VHLTPTNDGPGSTICGPLAAPLTRAVRNGAKRTASRAGVSHPRPGRA
jgi:hypothetical protein